MEKLNNVDNAYLNLLDQVKEQLKRRNSEKYELPSLNLNYKSYNRVDDIKYEDIRLVNYESHPTIKAPMAV